MINNRIRSRRREAAIAEDIEGRAHAMSGGIWNKKGDASNSICLIEDKFTAKDSYKIEIKILNKIEREALNINKIPVLRFGFTKEKRDYVLLRECDYVLSFPPYLEILDTDSSSTEVSYEYIYKKSVTLHKIFLKINFSVYNKSYVCMSWDNFLEYNKYLISKGTEK